MRALSKDSILSVSGLKKAFGGVKAIDGVSFEVPRGTITGLIGPNGAGKSSVVNALSGFFASDEGHVMLDGTDVTNWPSHKIAQAGLIRTFQMAQELKRLTVFENLLLAPQSQPGHTAWQALVMRKQIAQWEREMVERASALLERFNLYHVRNEYAGNLSGGQKKLLDLARALMAEPHVVLLDEPMAGVNPTLAGELQEHIRALKDQQGITFLLIEHNLGIVESLCDHVIVMAEGRILADGTMATLRDNQDVVKAYLGA